MSHYGPMYETEDITGWTPGQLANWLGHNAGWGNAEIKAASCEICGDVAELARPVDDTLLRLSVEAGIAARERRTNDKHRSQDGGTGQATPDTAGTGVRG